MTRRSSSTIAVLGDGGWGTTLAIHLHRLGHHVIWWGVFPEYIVTLQRRRENAKYLPDIHIPRTLAMTADLRHAVRNAQLIVLAIPSQYLRGVAYRLRGHISPNQVVISVAKGLERRSLKRMSEVIQDELGDIALAVLSGPNISTEIARGQPASSVVASHAAHVAQLVQRAFTSDRFRLYTSDDVTGVELGGALKNPIAIAAGISDGLSLGANAKAALVTRGIVEIARLGIALGAREETFWGLSGLGDLITTCLAGRNRWLGEQLGRGKRLSAALASTASVIEGVETAKAALSLGRRVGVELPIIEQVNAVLVRGTSPTRALKSLMGRAQKPEFVSR